MDLTQLTNQLKEHVKKNRMKEVLETLSELLRVCKSERETDVLLLTNRFHHEQAQKLRGMEDAANINQINFAIISLINELPNDPEVQVYFKTLNTQTVHRGTSTSDNLTVSDDFLEATLHRHAEDSSRELKSWLCKDLDHHHIIKISTSDPKPQGAFFEKTNQIVFGRSPEHDIVINNPHISRKHASISVNNSGRPVVIDYSSTNGTFLNNIRVQGDAMAIPKGRSTLQLDKTAFTIEYYSTAIDSPDE